MENFTIDIKKIKLIPKGVSDKFGMCVYGSLTDEINDWINFHGMTIENKDSYTNIFTDKFLYDLFNSPKQIKYLDGFSPNLNKHLHIGHFSNLILAKSFKSLGISKETIAILGDTLQGEISKEKALNSFKNICENFEYKIDKIFFASEMIFDKLLEDGEEEYAGTKIFKIGDDKIVGKKSDGTTSYFYQDVALANHLNDSILYLTGSEQKQHFDLLKKIYPQTFHIGLGLVKANGVKMSSRLGNVIWMKEILDLLMEEFNNDEKLCYNIFAGLILKSSPTSDKNINLDQIKNPLNSPGLYLSYTLAKLKSAGVNIKNEIFKNQDLQFKHLKSIDSMMPNILLESLLEHAKKINALYITHKIIGNKENELIFSKLGSDLLYGMTLLGMFDIKRV